MRIFWLLSLFVMVVLSLAGCTVHPELYDVDGGADVGQAADGTRIPLAAGTSVTVRAVVYERGYETTTLEADDVEPEDPTIVRVEAKPVLGHRHAQVFELTALRPGQTVLTLSVDGERRGSVILLVTP